MKNVKFNRLIRFLQILLVFILLASVCLLVTACKCQHDYEEEITVPATCGRDGIKTYTCLRCGESYTEPIPATGEHNLSTVYLKDDDAHWQKCNNCDYVTDKVAHKCDTVVSSEQSTCTKQGKVIKSCVCGQICTETLSFAEHDYKVYQKQGDEHWLKCANCDSTTEKAEHKYTIEVEVTASTCTKQGNVVKACVCGATITETLPLAQHQYIKTLFDDDGHWTVCSMCGAENPNQPKTSHNLSTVTVAAECEKAGKTVTSCSDCGYEHTVVLPALEHDLNTESGFSCSSTGSGHYYKCNRCGKDVAVPHTLVDYDCAENRAATCYKKGIQYQQCTTCGWRDHVDIPMTDDHDWSDEWTSNGTFHWHACTNGNGQCSAHGEETAHVWEYTVLKQANCTENGSSCRKCICGAVQSGSNKTIEKLGHDYFTFEVVIEATCTHDGLIKQRCSRCEEEIEVTVKKLEHEFGRYVSTAEGHYRQCINCDFTQSNLREHSWIETVVKAPTCKENGITKRTCSVCGFSDELTTTRDHDYQTVEGSQVDATCTTYATHVGICSMCHESKTFVDSILGYAPHSITYYPAKEPTDTEYGYRNHWKCSVCNGYFSSHSCETKLTEEEVFIPPIIGEKFETVAQLIEFTKNNIQDNTVSDRYYLITGTVGIVDTDNRLIDIHDKTSDILAGLIEREDLFTINENDIITLKCKLSRSGNDVSLKDCEVISVDCGDEELYSLSTYVTGLSSNIVISGYCADTGDTFVANTNYYNCLLKGQTVVFNIVSYGDKVLERAIVNGKSVTVTDGTLSVEVDGNVRIELTFGQSNQCSVTLREICTNNNGNAVYIDEYLSYRYTNDNNDTGRLYRNSHLTFSVTNANIIGLNITYDADWLAEHPDVLDNVVNMIKDNGTKVELTQVSNGNSKITVSVSAEDACAVLEYFASASQARVEEITVRYQTYNDVAPDYM